MTIVFGLLFLLSLIALPIGLIKPAWIIRRDGVSRKKFGLGMVGIIVSLFILIGVTAPVPSKEVKGTSVSNVSPTATPVSETSSVESDSVNLAASSAPTITTVVTPTLEPTKVTPPSLAPTRIKTPTPTNESVSVSNKTYVNSAGQTVQSPSYTKDGSVPAGASAKCGDGTYSFSQSRRGTCSHHGGVARWL